MIQDQPLDEQTLFNEVSTLLKGFRTILTKVEEVATMMAQNEDYTSHLKKLLDVMAQMQSPAKVVDYQLPMTNQIESIFVRFINRLNEIIKNASKLSYSYNGSYFIEKLLKKLLDSLKTAETSRNIGLLFCNILRVFKQFTIVAQRLYFAEPLPQDVIFVEKNVVNIHDSYQSNKQSVSIQQKPQETQFQKAMNVFNGYYWSLNCLDIDYSAFKSFYFKTRAQKSQNLTQQMIKQNGIVSKAIAHYNKCFQDFQRKRQKHALRNIKLTSLEDIQPRYSPSIERHSIMTNYERRKTNHGEMLCEQLVKTQEWKTQIKNPQIMQKDSLKIDFKVMFNQNENKNRASYHVKNLYTTFRKSIRANRNCFFNNLGQNTSICKQIDLSKTINQNQVAKKQNKQKQIFLKLSPLKLNALPQSTMKQSFIQQISQPQKGIVIRPIKTLRQVKKPNQRQIQNISIKVYSFAKKLSRQVKLRAFKTQEKPSRFLSIYDNHL